MRPACRFYDGALLVEPVESRVSIGLQDSAKLSKVLYRMFRFAIRRIGEPNRPSVGASGCPVVANVGSLPTRFGFAVTRREHRNGNVIAVQLSGMQHMLSQKFH